MGCCRCDQTLEFTYARDEAPAEADDPTILEWAARHGLVLLTHDRKTVPPFAYDRVASGLAMPGVFVVAGNMPVGGADSRVARRRSLPVAGGDAESRRLLPDVIQPRPTKKPSRGQCPAPWRRRPDENHGCANRGGRNRC